MPDDEIHIAHIAVKELEAFATQVIEQAKEGQFIPITLQRARAHAHNPAACPDDIALLVAYQGQELVGFFGILPILLQNGEKVDKVHWFSTWRVLPQLRGKSVGSLLMKEALSLGLDVMIVGSGPARKVCRRFGFWERSPLVYYRLDLTGMGKLNPAAWLMRLLRRLLRPFKVRLPVENGLTRFTARLLSGLTRPFFTAWLLRASAGGLEGIKVVETNSVRAETPAQKAGLPRVHLRRGPEMVNWMLAYPWVVEPGQSPTENMDFYFSDVRPTFRSFAVEIIDSQGEYHGYVVFQVSRLHDQVEAKILDVSLAEPADRRCLLGLAARYAARYHASQVDLPAEAVAGLRKSTLGRLLLQRRERIYQCLPKEPGSALSLAWPEIHFSYSDGDMPFS
jgi:GNAT superfamily N-acetyltransferase